MPSSGSKTKNGPPRKKTADTRTDLARRVVANAAATYLSRRNVIAPRGMAGSGLPFARNGSGNFADNFGTLAPIPKRQAVAVGPHRFHATSLRKWLATGKTTNPLTRAPLPQKILRTYGPPAREGPNTNNNTNTNNNNRMNARRGANDPAAAFRRIVFSNAFRGGHDLNRRLAPQFGALTGVYLLRSMLWTELSLLPVVDAVREGRSVRDVLNRLAATTISASEHAFRQARDQYHVVDLLKAMNIWAEVEQNSYTKYSVYPINVFNWIHNTNVRFPGNWMVELMEPRPEWKLHFRWRGRTAYSFLVDGNTIQADGHGLGHGAVPEEVVSAMYVVVNKLGNRLALARRPSRARRRR